MIFTLSLVLTIFCLLQFWLIIKTPTKWYIKFVLPILTVYLTVSTAFVFSSIMGYPTPRQPKAGQLLAVVIREPVPSRPGNIYLLVSTKPVRAEGVDAALAVFSYENKENHPRLFVIPYTDSEQKKYQGAKKALEEGKKVMIEDGDEEGEEGKGDSKRKKRGSTTIKGVFSQFYDELQIKPELKFIDPRIRKGG